MVFAIRTCVSFLAHFLGADGKSIFRTMYDTHTLQTKTPSPEECVQHARHHGPYLHVRETSAEQKWCFGATKWRTCKRALAPGKKCGKLARRRSVGLSMASKWPFATHAGASNLSRAQPQALRGLCWLEAPSQACLLGAQTPTMNFHLLAHVVSQPPPN